MPTYTDYGAWAPSSSASKRMRLRFDWSIGTPAVGASTVAVSLIISVEAGYGFWDNNASYSRSGALGSASGQQSVSVSTNGSTVIERLAGSLPIYQSGPHQVAVAASLSGIGYIGSSVTASHTSTVTLPGRVSGLPGRPAPSASLRSDTEAVVSWGATDQADRYYVEQWSEAHQRWTRLGTVHGTSVVDYGLSPNNRYKWRVCAGNAHAESAWAETGGVRTTPNAPRLAVSRSGQSIEVALTSAARYPQHWYLERRIDGGQWQYWTQNDGSSGLASMVPAPGQTVQFRGRSGVSEGGQRWSAWTTTGVIPALTPPNPPTLLQPSGVVSNVEPTRLLWRHESRDLTGQSAAEVRWQRPGVGSWETRAINGDAGFVEVPLSSGAWVWQARTRGAHADWSGWSQLAGFRVAPPPQVTITSPRPGGTVNTNRIRIAAQGVEASAEWRITGWEAQLHDLTDGHLVASWSGGGQPGTITAPALAADMHRHRASVRARSGSGLWSEWARVEFLVDYAEPAAPKATGRFLEEEGAVVIDATAQPGAVPTTLLRVDVSRDSGISWEGVGVIPYPGGSVTDATPQLGQAVSYRVVAVSELPTESAPAVVTVGTQTRRVWLLGDDGTKAHLVLDMDLQLSHSQELVLAEYESDGVEVYPTPHYGRGRGAQMQFSGALTPRHGSPLEVWLRLLGQRVWWRDPSGTRWRATIAASGIAARLRRGRSRVADVSGTVVRVDD